MSSNLSIGSQNLLEILQKQNEALRKIATNYETELDLLRKFSSDEIASYQTQVAELKAALDSKQGHDMILKV
jgi:hypothetical protein